MTHPIDMKKIEQLLEIIDDMIAGDGNWIIKKDAILSKASEDQVVNLEEFCSWFMEGE